MAPTQPKMRSRAEWAEILDRIQTELARNLEQTLELAPLMTSAEPTDSSRAPFDALDCRMEEIQAALKRAERCAAETAEVLDSDAETLRLWTETVKQIREKLTKCNAFVSAKAPH